MIDLDSWEVERLTALAEEQHEAAVKRIADPGAFGGAGWDVPARERDAQRWRDLVDKLKRAGL